VGAFTHGAALDGCLRWNHDVMNHGVIADNPERAKE
jgi:hypothetical protein